MKQAAIIADRWGMDIVDILAEDDDLLWACRAAGHQILYQLEQAAARK